MATTKKKAAPRKKAAPVVEETTTEKTDPSLGRSVRRIGPDDAPSRSVRRT